MSTVGRGQVSLLQVIWRGFGKTEFREYGFEAQEVCCSVPDDRFPGSRLFLSLEQLIAVELVGQFT